MKKTIWTFLCFSLVTFSFALLHLTQVPYAVNQNESITPFNSTNPHILTQEIGDNKLFWAVDFDADEFYQVNAYLLAIGDHCYIYFDDLVISILGEPEASARAETYCNEFDTNIYSQVTDLAGNPNGTLGDIDGDSHVIILIVEKRQSYYRQSNEVEGEHSNMCEMVYICYRTANPINTIAHEFHHLVWFNNEWDEVHFILEGAAEYATYHAGYLPTTNFTVRVSDFLNNIDDSLIYFEVEAQDYGACYLLSFYLAEQYGVQFLRDLVQHEGDGAAGLEAALEDAGHDISFNELYLDWMTALTIDQPGFAGDRYCFQNMDATIQDYTTIEALPYQDDNLGFYCYGSEVYQLISPPDNFTIEMSQPAGGVAGLSVAYRDTQGWHVQQLQKEGRAIMNVNGDSIDIAHVIASYLYAETPAGENDFGSGPRETVQVWIHETNDTTSTPATTPTPTPINDNTMLLIIAGALPVSATIIVLVLMFQKKREKANL